MSHKESTASEWAGRNYTVEQLSAKLFTIREQLKKAITRIVSLEEREALVLKRLSALELKVAIELTKHEPQKDDLEEESVDSLQDTWQADKQPGHEGQISLPLKPIQFTNCTSTN